MEGDMNNGAWWRDISYERASYMGEPNNKVGRIKSVVVGAGALAVLYSCLL
jgi:hypothetical protein